MRYPIYNRWAYWALFAIDVILNALPKRAYEVRSPKKILLCNTAHLGDVILTTALLPILKRAFPEVKIGMLIGSWSLPLIENHPIVYRAHAIDHWKINRKKALKICRYFAMRRRVIAEIKEERYDVAIDCCFHFPNMAPVLWRAKIPMRIGFSNAGFGPLLTHSYLWSPHDNCSAVESYFSLLQALDITDCGGLKPNLFHAHAKKEHYLVIHMGSGNPQKNWPLEKWQKLVKQLIDEGECLYFTGVGEQESHDIEAVIAGLPRVTNLCNRLNWKDFTAIIQKAALLIGVDTSAGHIAAAVDTPSVLIYSGIHSPQLWRPFGGTTITLTHATPCSPCFRGCAQMTCVRELSVDKVYHAIRTLKGKPKLL